jgi:hypothetical protein
MEGKTPDQIAEAVQAAYAKGELPKMEMVAFAYMFSADQDLGPGVGHWHPHMTAYTPYYEMYGPPRDCKGKVWSRRQVCANVFGLWVESSSPGQDELRACLSLLNSSVVEDHS